MTALLFVVPLVSPAAASSFVVARKPVHLLSLLSPQNCQVVCEIYQGAPLDRCCPCAQQCVCSYGDRLQTTTVSHTGHSFLAPKQSALCDENVSRGTKRTRRILRSAVGGIAKFEWQVRVQSSNGKFELPNSKCSPSEDFMRVVVAFIWPLWQLYKRLC